MKEITIDGIVYVPKDTNEPTDYSIVRTKCAGVFFGILTETDLSKGVVKVKNARRLWYWDGAASLSQLAVDGTSKPQNCKFPCEVPMLILTEVIEVLPCTKESVASIQSVKVWKI